MAPGCIRCVASPGREAGASPCFSVQVSEGEGLWLWCFWGNSCDLLRCSTQNFDRLISFSPFSRIQVSRYQQVPLLSLVVGFRCSHEFMCCLLEAVHVQRSQALAKLTVQANDNAAQWKDLSQLPYAVVNTYIIVYIYTYIYIHIIIIINNKKK